MTQLALDLTNTAINQAELHANAMWLYMAHKTVLRLARSGRIFTTDDVWAQLDRSGIRTHEPRALGAVMLRAVKDNTIQATGSYRKSTRPECHRRPIPVYVGVK